MKSGCSGYHIGRGKTRNGVRELVKFRLPILSLLYIHDISSKLGTYVRNSMPIWQNTVKIACFYNLSKRKPIFVGLFYIHARSEYFPIVDGMLTLRRHSVN